MDAERRHRRSCAMLGATAEKKEKLEKGILLLGSIVVYA